MRWASDAMLLGTGGKAPKLFFKIMVHYEVFLSIAWHIEWKLICLYHYLAGLYVG